MAYVKRNKRMDWTDAIVRVLAEEGGGPMSVEDITNKIIDKKYYCIDSNNTSKQSVNRYLSVNKDNLFERVRRGVYKLKGTPAPHTTASRVAPVVVSSYTSVRSCTSYHLGEAKYKSASDFVDSTAEKHANLSDLEKKLLELIVNFRLPLVTGEVCFADILDDLEVQILDEEKSRLQLIDATLLKDKLDELNEQIAEFQIQQEYNPQLSDLNGGLLWRMRSAAEEAKQRLQENTSDDVVKFEYPILGEFISGGTPKVVIYLKSIENHIRNSYCSRESVMAAVFVHEMFHAWNYFNAGRKTGSVLAIDEPMVEFETLYFLKELEAFAESQSNPLHKNVLSVRVNREFQVKKKQQSIGDVAAYGFGYYLFEKLSEIDADESIKWIETYSKKSASINDSDQLVKQVRDALIPIYPFKSEDMVMECFKEIIFKGQATSMTVGKSATAKISNTMSEVIYKIRVNRPCRLFIDEEELMTLKENELTKITLPEGEYLRKVVAEDDTTIFDEKVISLFHPKVDDIALDAISLEEAKRNALPDEFFQGDLCFKPTKDRLSVEVVDTKEYVDTINIPDQIKYAGYVYPVIRVQLSRKFDLKSITILDGVKRIIIDSCSSLTSIIIPNSLTSIGNRAFEGCTSLKSITIPNSVTWIGERAFYYCTSLASVTIPNSVTEILDSAFADCYSLTALDYTGTKEQWMAINKGRVDFDGCYREYWKEDSNIRVVHCTDGDVKI